MKFEFNDFGVCTNPKMYGSTKENPFNGIIVSQYHNGKWCFGARYAYDHNGGGCFGCNKEGAIYDSEREAVLAGIKWMKEEIERRKKSKETYYVYQEDDRMIKKHETYTQMQACYELAYQEVTQLSLF